MGYMAKDTGSGESNFEPVSAGTHVGRCVRILDLGTQADVWQGETKYRDKLYIGFEVTGERAEWKDKDGKDMEGPKMIGSVLTLSISNRALLGQWLENWRGREFTDEERAGFDVFTIADKPCLLTVSHRKANNGKTYADIKSISNIVKGMQTPDREGELLLYSPQHPEFNDPAVLEKFPKWLREKAAEGYDLEKQLSSGKTPESSAVTKTQEALEAGTVPSPDDFDDDIPF